MINNELDSFTDDESLDSVFDWLEDDQSDLSISVDEDSINEYDSIESIDELDDSMDGLDSSIVSEEW